ncbi:MAG TPA: cyclase family protein [Lautropia sp.]|nr:cyclase family protein [Lautropia sp.]
MPFQRSSLNLRRKVSLKACSAGLFAIATMALVTVPVAAQQAGSTPAQPAADWFPSKWGAGDEKGAANYMTPQRVAEAAKLVKTGKVYELGITVTADTPAFPPRGCKLYVLQPGQQAGESLGPNKTTYNDDILNCWVGIGSQLDGLGHLGIDNVYYNGHQAKDFAQPTGLTKLGIETVPAMVARGVLLDMAAYMGAPVLKEGTAYNREQIEGAAKKQGVEIREGDVVIFHSGWLSLIESDPKRYGSVEPGLGKDGALYLASKNVMAVGADTWGVEVLPFEAGVGVFEVHQILLAKNGIFILENMNTAALAKDKVYEFMFVLGHNKYKGAVQSMINPVAIN